MVLFSHSLELSGSGIIDPFYKATNWVSFSTLGVFGFFVISGYLVTQSLERDPRLVQFLLKRIRRIYPGFVAALLFTMLIALFAFDGKLSDFLSYSSVQTYLPVNLLMFWRQDYLADVFARNPYPRLVNGSLWTLSYEWLFYLVMVLLIPLIRNRKMLLTASILVFAGMLIFHLFFSGPYYDNFSVISPRFGFTFGLFFLGGAILSQYRNVLQRYATHIVCIALALLVAVLWKRQIYYAQFFVLPFLVIGLGEIKLNWVAWFRKYIGDLSFGLYIYAFPVQQLLVQELHPPAFYLLGLTMLICVPLAYLSWNFIEKPFLIKKASDTVVNKLYMAGLSLRQ